MADTSPTASSHKRLNPGWMALALVATALVVALMLGRFTEDLSALQRAIRWGDGEALFTHFTRTRAVRRSIIDLGQEVDAPDFGRRTKPDDETQ